MTPARRAIIVSIVIAFLAGLGGVGLGQLIFAPKHAPSLHELLHHDLDLSAEQSRRIEVLERDFAARRQALELEMRAANAELAAAMREEHVYGPRVTAAVERFHHAMGELQSETMQHVFAMREVLTPAQRTRFDDIVGSALTAEQR
ncbi:MAG: heavy metal resistance protein [Alphaproteobacteria bacterium]|nr:MAG: heavy metal resistance protein [Alphaproteobacteria bacterium]